MEKIKNLVLEKSAISRDSAAGKNEPAPYNNNLEQNQKKIRKLLIANRGEIAKRIENACQKRGIVPVMVYSEADSNSYHIRQAKEKYYLGGSNPKESYLSVDKIVTAAKELECDAVHPGYGFLSENPLFAKAVEDAGLLFVGPTSEMIAKLGNKVEARRIADKVSVPTTQGTAESVIDDQIISAAELIGFPVIIKASAGGGGRGMRIAHTIDELKNFLPLARSEALKNFANENVYIEQFIDCPRHVEVQIFGDGKGNIIHFGTRDCSTQRRHQKLVEEAPAPYVEPKLLERIQYAAVTLTSEIKYLNAGTVEFLIKDENFYFLEVNTRIQVEHPVSEMITGVDLIDLQLYIAEYKTLPFKQSDIQFSGHAIEFRINAEDWLNSFYPSFGKIGAIRRSFHALSFGDTAPIKNPPCTASFPNVTTREDYGYEPLDTIPVYYDSLLSKLIIHAQTRIECILAAEAIFKGYEFEGIKTTIPFFQYLLRFTNFRNRPIHIKYVDQYFINLSNTQKFTYDEQVSLLNNKVATSASKNLPLTCTNIKFIEYTNKKGDYLIKLIERDQQTFTAAFIAIPFPSHTFYNPNSLSTLHYPRPEFCRSSNTREHAVQSLIDEVLNEYAFEQIFSKNL
jgi:acetyl/propionyl-CoA carboxylase alpha subunit